MIKAPCVALLACATLGAQLKSGPPLPYHVVEAWAQLPEGMNFGECSGVAVDRNDNVWVFNRGTNPVIQFDKNGKVLQVWKDIAVRSSHGIRVDSEGNIWGVDVKGHVVIKYSPKGKVLMIIGNRQGTPGNNDSKEAFNEPTNLAFSANGDIAISDGYQNSRVIKFNRDGEFLTKWGSKGTGPGQFNLVHDIVRDTHGRYYVGDRNNNRVQVFDNDGKFLNQWNGIGSPWGLDYVARENAIYMCDGANDRILKLNLDGEILGVLGSHGKTPGKLDFAHSIAVDSAGAIYVAEIKNWRVQKFVPNR